MFTNVCELTGGETYLAGTVGVLGVASGTGTRAGQGNIKGRAEVGQHKEEGQAERQQQRPEERRVRGGVLECRGRGQGVVCRKEGSLLQRGAEIHGEIRTRHYARLGHACWGRAGKGKAVDEEQQWSWGREGYGV